jgi:CheY-like chemotaxis protein
MPTVLVIDANESIVLLLEMMLTRANYAVLSARDGDQGFEMAHHNQPGVILLDEFLPGMSGAEVCIRLKNDLRTRHIPIVLSTAALVRDPLAHARRAGADGVLCRPFRADDLLGALQGFLPC